MKFVGARGQNPTPFITRAYTDDTPEHYSPDVRYEGDRAMRFNSDVSKTYGGQPGTGRGVKSDTYMDRTFPQTHSTNIIASVIIHLALIVFRLIKRVGRLGSKKLAR